MTVNSTYGPISQVVFSKIETDGTPAAVEKETEEDNPKSSIV